MDFVARRRAEGSYRLFTSFKFQPSSDKLSAKFVRDFSNLKTSLGIGPENTFHSSRHNISTMLRNTKASDIREIWIDSILGHAGSQDDTGGPNHHSGHAPAQVSEGLTTYMHDVDIENLQRTVEAIQYPGVDFGLVMTRVTGSP
jgi:integrase